jgi:hypothetical protein
MDRQHRIALALIGVVACSGATPRPEPPPPSSAAAEEAAAEQPAPAAEEAAAAEPTPPARPTLPWSVEPHVAVRSPVAADFSGGTLVALSGSATVVIYRLDGDVVVSTSRVARRLDGGEVVCGRRECAVRWYEYEGDGAAMIFDLATGRGVATDAEVGYAAGPDGELGPVARSGSNTDDDWSYRRSSTVDAAETGYDVLQDDQNLEIRGITGGGEHSIHGVTVHPRGRGVLIHQRAGVVYVRASGAREVACLDERSAAFTPDGTRVVQGEDGVCDPETDAGHPATPDPGYGSGYGSSYAATEVEEPTYEDRCSPTDTHVCVRLPDDDSAPLSLVIRGRPRRLAGTGGYDDVRFSPDGRVLAIGHAGAVRGYALPRGREIAAFHRDGVELIEVLHDGALLLRTDAGVSLVGRDGTETHVTDADVHAEGITQHDDGSLYLCTSGGLSVRERGASTFRSLTNVPCGRVATLPSGVAVTSGVDGGDRSVISLADGHVIGTYGAPWIDDGAPLDAEAFARCTEAGTLEHLDVTTLEARSVPGCDRSATYSSDGSLIVRDGGAGVEVQRTSDGARLELRVIRAHGRAAVVALAEDGAFWAAGPEDAALVDLVRREDDVIVEALRGSSERATTHHYRPTLLSDFFEGRPLPLDGE